MPEQQVLFLALAALVALLMGLSKGGLGGNIGGLATPLMALVLPADQVLGLVLPLLMVADVFAIAAHWRRWEWRMVLLLLPGAIVGITLGTLFITRAPINTLRAALGIVVLLFAMAKLLEHRLLSLLQGQIRDWHSVLAGGISGLASSLAHTGAPPVSIYLLLRRASPAAFLGTSALFFGIVNWIKVPYYYAAGLFNLPLMLSVAWLFPLLPLGVWLGKWLTDRVSRQLFERVITVALALSALLLISDALVAAIDDQNAGAQPAVLGPAPEGAAARLGRGAVRSLALSADGGLLAVGSQVGVFLYQVDGSQDAGLTDRWMIPSLHPVTAVAFSPDGVLLAAGRANGSTELLDASNGARIDTLTGPDDAEVHALAWARQEGAGNPDYMLASGLNNGVVLASTITRVSASLDAAAAWEARLRAELPALPSGASALAFASNGRVLAAGTRGGLIALWAAPSATNNPIWLATLVGHRRGSVVLSLDWSADSRDLISVSNDGQALLWDVLKLSPKGEVAGGPGPAASAAFLPGDVAAAVLDGAGLLRLVDAGAEAFPSGESWHLPAQQALRPGSAQALASAWSADGRRVALAGSSGELALWQVDEQATTGASITPLIQPGAVLHSPPHQWSAAVAWSPDGRRLAAGSGSTIQVWEMTPARSAGGYRPPLPRSARTYTPEIGRAWRLEGHSRLVSSLAWSPDGRTLASGSLDGSVRLWDARTAAAKHTLLGHTDAVFALAWAPDSAHLASSGALDDQVILWDARSGQQAGRLPGAGGGVWGLAWSPDGATLAAGANNGDILLWLCNRPSARGGWSCDNQDVTVLRRHVGWTPALAFSPDGRLLASGGVDTLVVIWDVAARRPLQTLSSHGQVVRGVSFSPDSSRLASVSHDGLLLLWQPGDPSFPPIEVLPGHAGKVDAVAWSPDGRLLATAAEDGAVLLWPHPLGQ